jgi:hypothetical protein
MEIFNFFFGKATFWLRCIFFLVSNIKTNGLNSRTDFLYRVILLRTLNVKSWKKACLFWFLAITVTPWIGRVKIEQHQSLVRTPTAALSTSDVLLTRSFLNQKTRVLDHTLLTRFFAVFTSFTWCSKV